MKADQEFKNPSSPYRGKPFWSWNGKLEPEELRRQIRVLKHMGMGGGFLHSRVGLETEFLGKKWFECIKACVDECKKHKMEAWLYDEDRWPSGSAGGLVTKDPKHRMRFLVMEMHEPTEFKRKKSALGTWQCRFEDNKLYDLIPLKKNEKPVEVKNRKVMVIYEQLQECSSWYNGYTYLDTMSAEAVKEFIRVSYQPYKKKIGQEFGKAVPGVFTDEPNYFTLEGNNPGGVLRANIPWTPRLPEVFEKRYGYDLLEHLPELFLDVEGVDYPTARYHYRDCATFLFTGSFARLIGQWCEKNDLLFTGHVLLENNLHSQTLAVGSTMRFYEHMQAPGIDILTQRSYEYDTAKQCSSVLNQMGRKWMLSELYGCTGWDFPMEGHKALGDWQTALGVNLRCHHLSWYTMKGEAKRDYPASIFFQSAWWEHYKPVEDYYSRLHVALTQGKSAQRLLVIHPIESTWLRFMPVISGLHTLNHTANHHEDVRNLDKMMADARDWLLKAHIDFDYGDEDMLYRLGSVRKGKKGPALKLGKANYDAVLVLPQLTIRETTLNLLDKFQKAGGKVIFAGDAPEAVNGQASDGARKLARGNAKVDFNREAVTAACECCRDVFIQDSKGNEIESVVYMLRRHKDRSYLFFCNTDRQKGFDQVRVKLNASGKVMEWDAMTGEKYLIKSEKKKSTVAFETSLPPSGSRLFVVDPEPPKGLAQKPVLTEAGSQSLDRIESFQMSEPNVLVLDCPEYKIGKEDYQPPKEILKVDYQVRKNLGVEHRGGRMVQPWARKTKKKKSKSVALRYRFHIDTLPQGETHLVMETPERFGIRLNNHPLSYEPLGGGGWWVDPCLEKIAIDPSLLRLGENVLHLCILYEETDGLEAIFLTGDFGVKVEGGSARVTAAPEKLEFGDWCGQGLPFYGAGVNYRFRVKSDPPDGERVLLKAPAFEGAMARVLVDGEQAGFILWPPYELDITEYNKGKKEIEIGFELISSRRNTFGPLHQKHEPWAVGPGNFVTEGDDWSDAYVLKPCGLMEPPVLSYQRVE